MTKGPRLVITVATGNICSSNGSGASAESDFDPAGIIANMEQVNELINREQALEDFALSTKLPQAGSGAGRSISRVIIDTED